MRLTSETPFPVALGKSLEVFTCADCTIVFALSLAGPVGAFETGSATSSQAGYKPSAVT